MAHALQRVTPQFVSVPITAGVIGQAQNNPGAAGWAGYYANVSDQGISGLHWQDIYSDWYVPAANNSDNAHPLLTWVGYGGGPGSNPNYLVQAGTWTCGGNPCIPAGGTAQVAQYTFWYENWPLQSVQADSANSLHIAPGDDYYQDVYNVSSTSTQFFFEDVTRNTYTGFTQSGEQTNTNASAEWVFEDPYSTPYAFSTNRFFQAGASGLNGIGSNAFQNFRIYNIYMLNYANPAATIDTTNNGFHVCYGATNQC